MARITEDEEIDVSTALMKELWAVVMRSRLEPALQMAAVNTLVASLCWAYSRKNLKTALGHADAFHNELHKILKQELGYEQPKTHPTQ